MQERDDSSGEIYDRYLKRLQGLTARTWRAG
jgi:hypothetical protein